MNDVTVIHCPLVADISIQLPGQYTAQEVSFTQGMLAYIAAYMCADPESKILMDQLRSVIAEFCREHGNGISQDRIKVIEGNR